MNIYSRNAADIGPGTSRGAGVPSDRPWQEQEDGSADQLNVAALVHLFLAHIWLLVILAAVGAALGAWSFYKQTPLYTAGATVVLETQNSNVVEFTRVVQSSSSSYYAMNTEIMLLRSRDLVERIVDDLRLERTPEFNPALRRPSSGWKELIGYDRVAQSLGWSESGGLAGWIDPVMSVVGLGPKPPLPIPDPQSARETAIGMLYGKLNVSRVEDTYALQLTATSEDPALAAAIANRFAERYIERKREISFEATDKAMKWLSGRVIELKEELEKAEGAVEEFASGSGLVNEEALIADSQRMKSMRDRQAEQLAAADELRARIARLEALRASGDFAELGRALGNPSLGRRAEALAGQAGDTAALRRFDAEFGDWLQALRVQTQDVEAQASVLTAPIAELQQSVEAQTSDLVALRQLRREAEAARLVYEYSLRRMKEISIQDGIQQGDARLLSGAMVPGSRSADAAKGSIAKGGAIGLLLGIALVMLRNMMRVNLRTPEELEAATGLAVMGTIPKVRSALPIAMADYLARKPASGLAEAIRNLRTAIQLSDIDARPQVIMVTSSLPGEGKTSMAISLAQSWARSGKKVLLLDCDLRRGSIQKQFDIEGGAGLIAVLSGNAPFEEAVVSDEDTGIDILIADSAQVTGVDVFGSKSFDAFLKSMQRVYDFIILDTPPVLAIPDARVIGQLADAVLYLVKWNATTRKMVRSGLDQLHQVNVHVSGLALTQTDPKRMHRYGYHSYGYGYGERKIRKYYVN